MITTDSPTAELKIDEAGEYRVYVYVSDGTGFVSTVNSPVLVR